MGRGARQRELGACLSGRATTRASKKGAEKGGLSDSEKGFAEDSQKGSWKVSCSGV